jgi:hypothetical protein
MIGYVIGAICDLFGNTVPCAGTSASSSKNKEKMRRRYLKTKLRKVQGPLKCCHVRSCHFIEQVIP